MSERDSSVNPCNEQIDTPIEIELLVAEVKRRPFLYDKSIPEYTDREKKQQVWAEVCQAIFKQWNDYSSKKKKERVREVQCKWRSLKDTFMDQFSRAHQLTHSGKKKRKFPVQTLVGRDIPDNNNEAELDFVMATLARDKTLGDNILIPSTSQNIPNYEETWEFANKKFQGIPPIEEPKQDDIDENTHFALMLVPMMRKLNDEQRFYVRTGILRIMNEARLMGQEKVSILQDALKYPDALERTNLLQDLNYTETEAPAVDEEPVYSAASSKPRNEQGEIQYPETDNEDVDV